MFFQASDCLINTRHIAYIRPEKDKYTLRLNNGTDVKLSLDDGSKLYDLIMKTSLMEVDYRERP